MLLSPRKNSLDSLFKEVRVFKALVCQRAEKHKQRSTNNQKCYKDEECNERRKNLGRNGKEGDSYRSPFLLNPGQLPLEKQRNSVLNLGSLKIV